MTKSDVNKEAFKQAQEELLKDRIKEVKDFILQTLNKIEAKKKEKARVEEELRVLKLDLEDLRHGNFDKIEERREKSKVAKGVSVTIPSDFMWYSNTLTALDYAATNAGVGCTVSSGTNSWVSNTSGTYLTAGGNTVYIGAN